MRNTWSRHMPSLQAGFHFQVYWYTIVSEVRFKFRGVYQEYYIEALKIVYLTVIFIPNIKLLHLNLKNLPHYKVKKARVSTPLLYKKKASAWRIFSVSEFKRDVLHISNAFREQEWITERFRVQTPPSAIFFLWSGLAEIIFWNWFYEKVMREIFIWTGILFALRASVLVAHYSSKAWDLC